MTTTASTSTRPTPDIERRATRGLRLAEGRKIVGRAIVFGSPSHLLTYPDPETGEDVQYREYIADGALDVTLAANPDIRALDEHRPYRLIGRTKSGTLRLALVPGEGLDVEIDPPKSSIGGDLVEAIERGDKDAMSFGFVADDEAWGTDPDGVERRDIFALTLFEVSTVAWPAYEATSLSLRSRALARGKAKAPPLQAHRRRRLRAARLSLLGR